MTLTFIFILFGQGSLRAKEDDLLTLKLELKSHFKRNKKIWGTYNQYSESINHKKKRRLKDNNQDGDIIIQRGKFYMVRPVEKNGKTKVVVNGLDYEKPKKNIYLMNENDKRLYEMYGPKIERYLKIHFPKQSKKIGPNTTSFGQIVCKNKRGLIDCHLPIEIKIPTKS